MASLVNFFIIRMAGIVGSVGGACINNRSFYFKLRTPPISKQCQDTFLSTTQPNNLFFQLTFLHPPVRVTVGEVRYSIEIDVGGGKGSILQNQILRKILAENGPHV